MTRIEWWDDMRTGRTIQVNGCLNATITDREARDCYSWEYAALVRERLTPMVWLAMPTHE